MPRLSILIASVAICANAAAGDGREGNLQRVLAATLASDPSLPSVIAAVESTRNGLRWAGAVGRGGSRTIRASKPFRIASVTKTFTAAATLRLVEERKLSLNASIDSLISAETANTLRKGGYQPRDITLQELLNHTSGLFDYAGSPEYYAAVLSDPHKRWTRAEQIEFAMQHGRPVGLPGERFAYSDTGYVIVGEIVERAAGRPLPQAIRRLVGFERLGLRHTHFESLELGHTESLAAQYYQTTDMSGADPSFDLFGGGGIVSTVGDLVRFVRPLLQGKVFVRPETLSLGLSIPSAQHDREDTPHANLLVQTPLGTDLCWGHGGFWGVAMLYCPEADVAIALTINQADPRSPTVLKLAERLLAIANSSSTTESRGRNRPAELRQGHD